MKFNDNRLPPRFWAKVSPEDTGCWEWTASRSKTTGYGWYNLEGRAVNPHRVMCSVAHGKPADGLYAMHSCDNRGCVAPHHLRWGTPKDNIQDAIQKGRLIPGKHFRDKTHCPRDHEYTTENTYVTKAGARSCRECYRKHWREWNSRRNDPSYKSTRRIEAHGTVAQYQWGCRCDLCKSAKSREYQNRKEINT